MEAHGADGSRGARRIPRNTAETAATRSTAARGANAFLYSEVAATRRARTGSDFTTTALLAVWYLR